MALYLSPRQDSPRGTRSMTLLGNFVRTSEQVRCGRLGKESVASGRPLATHAGKRKEVTHVDETTRPGAYPRRDPSLGRAPVSERDDGDAVARCAGHDLQR